MYDRGQEQLLSPGFQRILATSFSRRSRRPSAKRLCDGLVGGICEARNAQDTALLPVRAHLFFRNLQGLWVCSDPHCSAAPARTSPCPVGQLHYTPALTCQCGSRVVELLYCEACGEVFLGGYRSRGVNPNEWYLSPDHPDLEASPDMASLDRDYARYAVFWPAANGLQPATQQWSQDLVQRQWQAAFFVPAEGRVAHGRKSRKQCGAICTAFRRCMGRTETFLIRLRKGLRQARARHIRPAVQGATRTGRGGTSDRQCGRSGPAFKNWRRFFLTFCCAKLAMRIRAGENWLFFLTAGKMQRNYPPECALRITATPFAKRSRARLDTSRRRSTCIYRATERSGLDAEQQASANAYAAAYPSEAATLVHGARTDGKSAITSISPADLPAGRSTHPAPRYSRTARNFAACDRCVVATIAARALIPAVIRRMSSGQIP